MRFIFSSFWVWLGFIILLYATGGELVDLVKICKRNRKITGYRIGERWHIKIENASGEDVHNAIMWTEYCGSGEDAEWEEDDGKGE